MTAQELLERYAAGERDFREADLQGADLRWAKLQEADLQEADLQEAKLQGAYLQGAYLQGADLRGVYLQGAELRGVYLKGADLQGADLQGADLRWAYLRGAYLAKTCSDPMTIPNGKAVQFQTINSGRWCVGYRTKNSPVIGGLKYTPGELRTAPVFSTADTECHPGIFVLPTENEARGYAQGGPVVKVIFRPWDCHQAGDKWRVRELIVWEDM